MIMTSFRAAGLALAASLLLAGSALAQTPAPAATPAPSAKTAKPRTAASLECSKEADAKGLHGKERKKFRSECKKQAADKAAPASK
jgi:psiF repeat-containing protein